MSDASTSGLRARVSADAKVTFILKARNAANKLKTITLGTYPAMSLKEARIAAAQARLDLKAGVDINAAKRQLRQEASNPASSVTLRALVQEFEAKFSSSKNSWAPRGPQTERSNARQVIERVFEDLLDRPAVEISEEEFAKAAMNYKPAKPQDGRNTANGQVSRARAYLGPVLDWAAGRKSYSKIGASRSPRLQVASLANTHDPAATDPTITGKRDRVLNEAELKKVLPLLTYPSPKIGKLKLDPAQDYRPIAMRFMLYTAARLDEVCSMRWKDLDRVNGVWRKPKVKSTKGGPRNQNLPLSEAALGILRSLPGWNEAKEADFVFPNGTGSGKLGNWTRFQNALHEETGITGWYRHDLRRTAATIMDEMKVPRSTIARILAHTDPLKAENLGGAASHYLQTSRILQDTRDPHEEALDILAKALKIIESS